MFKDLIRENEPLSAHTYYRLGGPARYFVLPKSLDDLKVISDFIKSKNLNYFVLGLGTNLLVSDRGFDGIVIKTAKLNLEITHNNSQIKVGASVPVSMLLRKAAKEGWAGLEMLTGVPGSVGGAVIMNAGTHLGETKDKIQSVEYYSLTEARLIQVIGPDLKFEYRKNLFLPKDAIVYSAAFQISKDEPAQVEAAISKTLERRKQTQPIELPSCGSVFKNPKASGLHSWQVIDRLGLRGHVIGGAQFSPKHCNFIVNLGSAKSADVKALIDLAKKRARDELQINLEEEVKYLGEF